MTKRGLDLDDILEELDRKGNYQIYNYILIVLPVLLYGTHMLIFVFTSDLPNYRCFVPECENLTNTSYGEPWAVWSIPQNITNRVLGVKTNTCKRYVVKNVTSDQAICTEEMFSDEIQHCTEFVFANDQRTIVNDFNLTCEENQVKVRLVSSFYMAGKLIGSILFGILADKYGRKTIFVFCTVLMGVFGGLQVLSPNYKIYTILLFLHAAVLGTIYPLGTILAVEMFGKRKRQTAGISVYYFNTTGIIIIAPLFWYTKNWVSTQLIVSVPAVVFVAYYWILPESVRWLVSKKEKSKALAILGNVSKFNNTPLSLELSPLTVSISETPRSSFLHIMKQLFHSKKLLYRIILLYIMWTGFSFIVFSMSILAITLDGNKYLNFSLVHLITLPSVYLATVLVKKFGTRITLIGGFFLNAVVFGLIIPASDLSPSWVIVSLYIFGKLVVATVNSVLHVYIPDVLPTDFRSAGYGVAFAFARLAGMGVSFVPALSLYYRHLPMILFGSLSILSGLIAMKLPEIVKMVDTVEEADEI